MISIAQYDKAIEALEIAKTQLEPDGRLCVICESSGHQAWECLFNPLSTSYLDHQNWRCFHCGEVFWRAKDAEKHFGALSDDALVCVGGDNSLDTPPRGGE